MTTAERTLLRAEIALLKAQSPTKGVGLRYTDDDWRKALTKISDRLTSIPFERPAR
ncbi:MAG: hypothetical protein PGN33_22045 [Methylobacterium radiotolerans]